MTARTFVPTICPYCGVGCGFYTVVENGHVVGLEYMPAHPVNQGALCPKGNAALEILSHPDRLRYPMRKADGSWDRVSWDEALDTVAAKLGETRDAHGANALGFLSSAKCTNEENYLFQKLARLLGTNNVDHCARLCHSPTVTGLLRAFGSGAMTNPIPDLAHATCVFIVGSNFAENHVILSRWILEAKERGARVIVADPRLTPTAWLADTFLQLRPGSDVALINGMIHVIVQEGLADRHFIATRTTGFEELAVAVREYTPERTAEITGLSPGLIVEAARAYARAEAAAIVYCMGVTQHVTGSDNVTACANLALICGQVGRPGSGIFPLRGQNNVQGACDMGALAEYLPGYVPTVEEGRRNWVAERWGVNNLPAEPGLTVVEMMDAAANGRLKAMVIMGENPMLSDPNANHVREALEKLDFLVVQDIFLTETAELADLVLPAAALMEKEGTITNTGRRVQWTGQAIAPPGEAKDDLWIIGQVAGRLGLDLDYPSAAAVLDEIHRAVPSYAGITPERIVDRIGGLHWPCPSLDHPGTLILHTRRFNTPDGRGRIVPVAHQPPAETTTASYPLVLTTGRVVLHHNAGSMTRRTESLSRRVPETFVEINPQDAARLGVKEGEPVNITTVRGQVEARAVLTEKLAPGVVFVPFHFPMVNALTVDQLDPVAKIPEFKVAACRVEKRRA